MHLLLFSPSSLLVGFIYGYSKLSQPICLDMSPNEDRLPTRWRYFLSD